jgi:hypothetical protein
MQGSAILHSPANEYHACPTSFFGEHELFAMQSRINVLHTHSSPSHPKAAYFAWRGSLYPTSPLARKPQCTRTMSERKVPLPTHSVLHNISARGGLVDLPESSTTVATFCRDARSTTSKHVQNARCSHRDSVINR